MIQSTKLVAESRTTSGGGTGRRLRKQGIVPAVINNAKGESRLVQLNRHDFEMMLHHHASENVMVDMEVDGRQLGLMLLKDVQHDPMTGAPLHVDFVEISLTRKLRLSIPVVLVGDAPGVAQGGVLEQPTREVEVECLPGDMVEQFRVDVSGLGLGGRVLVRDLALGDTFTVLTPPDVALAAVTLPLVEEEAPAEAVEGAAEAAPAEPEVISKGKKEEEEGAEEEAAPAPKKEKGEEKKGKK